LSGILADDRGYFEDMYRTEVRDHAHRVARWAGWRDHVNNFVAAGMVETILFCPSNKSWERSNLQPLIRRNDGVIGYIFLPGYLYYEWRVSAVA